MRLYNTSSRGGKMNIKDIGLFLSNKRKVKGLTQSELSESLNVSHQAVSRWERGENLPDVLKLVELAKMYNVTVDDILNHGNIVNEPVVTKSNHKENNYVIFSIFSVVLSTLGLLLFYILVLNGSRLWIGILVHYLIALSSTLLFILPYTLNQNRTRRLFELIRVDIVVSSMLLLLPIIGMIFSSYGYINVFFVLIDLFIGYVIYYCLILVEQKTYNVKVDNPFLYTRYISNKRVVEITIVALFSLVIILLGTNISVSENQSAIFGFYVTGISFILVIYYIVRNANIISVFQAIWFGFVLFTLYWWTGIGETLSDKVYLEYLLGVDESLFQWTLLSLLLIPVLLLAYRFLRKKSFTRIKKVNLQLLVLNIVLFVVFSISRPQFYIRNITESYGGIETRTTTYICEYNLYNNMSIIAFVALSFALIVLLDEINKFRISFNTK